MILASEFMFFESRLYRNLSDAEISGTEVRRHIHRGESPVGLGRLVTRGRKDQTNQGAACAGWLLP
jgi:hypothetical protein